MLILVRVMEHCYKFASKVKSIAAAHYISIMHLYGIESVMHGLPRRTFAPHAFTIQPASAARDGDITPTDLGD